MNITTKVLALNPEEKQIWDEALEAAYGSIRRLINISNHPSEKWEENQKRDFEEVVDMPFPNIVLHSNFDQIADQLYDKVREHLKARPWDTAIMVQGQHPATFAIVACFLNAGYKVLSAYTERMSVDNVDGTKTSKFVFGGYQEYRSRNVNQDFLSDYFYKVFPKKC